MRRSSPPPSAATPPRARRRCAHTSPRSCPRSSPCASATRTCSSPTSADLRPTAAPRGRGDTTTATGELVFHLFASLAQYERALIRERVVAGLEAARRRGRRGGRPRRLDAERVAAAKAGLAEGRSLAAPARGMGVPRSTLTDALRRAGA